MTRGDSLVIILAVAALPFLYTQYWGPSHRGTEVNIQVANQEPQQHSLLRDQTLSIDGHLGQSLIQIRSGKAAFIASPCKNKQCIHSGWLSRNGATSACLPNRISLSVLGKGIARYDSVNF